MTTDSRLKPVFPRDLAWRAPLGRTIVLGRHDDTSSDAAALIAQQLAARDDGVVHSVAAWPAEEVSSQAAATGASLIVVGLGKHRSTEHLFAHESAIAIARRATVPVLAVPSRTSALPERVLVGVDFTQSSRRAAQLAGELIARTGELVLAHVPSFAMFQGGGESWVDVYVNGASDRLDDERDVLSRLTHRRVTTIVGKGEPGEQLLALARKMCCDTIAVGAHAQGFADRGHLGSIATRVLRTATCPVLVAPRWR